MNRNEDRSASAPVTAFEINSLFREIKQYNDKFSIGGILGRVIRGVLDGESQGRSLGTARIEERESAVSIAGRYSGTLEKTGLSVEPVLGKAGTFFGLNDIQTGENLQLKTGEIRLNIQDRARFLEFLVGIKPIEISAATELRQNIESIADDLTRQLKDHYSLVKPSDEALELLAGLGQVVQAYRKLDLGASVAKLDVYAGMLEQRCLAEYLAIEAGGLMQEQGKGFGPADWQIDATPEQLKRRWDKVIAVLDVVQQNPAAKALHHSAVEHLIECAVFAQDNLDKSGLARQDPDAYRTVLNRAHGALLERQS